MALTAEERKARMAAEMAERATKMAAASRPQEATALQPHEVKGSEPREAAFDLAPAKPISGGKAEPLPEPAKAAKKSTSLYLTEDARRALNRLAADKGVRPHRIVDDALRAYFAQHDLDFDKLNGQS